MTGSEQQKQRCCRGSAKKDAHLLQQHLVKLWHRLGAKAVDHKPRARALKGVGGQQRVGAGQPLSNEPEGEEQRAPA